MLTATRPLSDDLPVVIEVPDEPAARSRSAFRPMLWAAFGVGALLRGLIALTDDSPTVDETAYLRSGLALVHGEGFVRDGRPELHFPPLIPFLAGQMSKIFDNPHWGVVFLTFVCSTLVVLPLALLGRRIGGDRAGIWTAWIAALAPGLSTSIVNRGAGSEAEYLLLVVAATWFVVSAAAHQGSRRLMLVGLSGLSLGLAYLTRPEGLLLAVPLGISVLVLAWRTRPRWGRSVALCFAFGIPILLCVVPYVKYLHDNTGQWELSAKTRDASIEAWRAVADSDRQARDRILYALDDSGYEFANTARYSLPQLAREDPKGYAGIVATNVGQLAAQSVRPETDKTLTWLLVPAPLLLLAVYGLWTSRRSRSLWVVAAMGGLSIFTCLVFFVQPRYLFVAAAATVVFTGVGLAAIPWPRWRQIIGAITIALLVASSIQAFRGPGGWWHPSDHTDQEAAAEWVAQHSVPGQRVMARSMVVEYYAGQQVMAIPYASLDQIVDYARHYEVSYIVIDWYTARRLRPQLLPLVNREVTVPGLRLVHKEKREGRITKVFALDPAPAAISAASIPMGPGIGFVGDS